MWITWLRFRPESRSEWLSFQLESTVTSNLIAKLIKEKQMALTRYRM
jgi:hypothetical protein